MKRCLTVLLSACLLFSSSSGFGADAPATPAPEPPKKLISVDFQDTALSTVLDVLSVKTNRKLLTDNELAKRRIVFTLRDVTADEALTALLDTYALYYVRQPNTNIYVIKSKGTAQEQVALVSKIITLNYALASDLSNTLRNNLSKAGSIAVDTRTNSLVITDAADSIDKIDAMIKLLDTPTLQVVLEAKILDGNISSDLNWGMSTRVWRDGLTYTNPLGITSPFSMDSAFDATKPLYQTMFTQSYAPKVNSFMGVHVLQNGYNIEAMIGAEIAKNDAKVLSSPRLLVLNNQEASIDIIEQFPYPAETVAGTPPIIKYGFKEIGIRMRVRPQINKDGSIVLNLSPEQSFRAGLTSDGIPIVNTSKAATTLMLQNGETAVIGGLIRESDTVSETKVPLLGDIPIIGFLFKSHSKAKARKELTIFITAKIVE